MLWYPGRVQVTSQHGDSPLGQCLRQQPGMCLCTSFFPWEMLAECCCPGCGHVGTVLPGCPGDVVGTCWGYRGCCWGVAAEIKVKQNGRDCTLQLGFLLAFPMRNRS